MKLYDYAPAPNPRRVRMYLVEKGITLPSVQIDLRRGEQLSAEFKRDNPTMIVPALVLDDGSLLTETMAICRYFEALQPEPPLFGRDPREQAFVEMWSRRAELEGFLAVAEALRNGSAAFTDRALPGPRNYAQIPALVARGKARIAAFFDDLDTHLANREFVVGTSFTVADITAFVTVEFAGWVDVKPGAQHAALARWHAAIAARPSAQT